MRNFWVKLILLAWFASSYSSWAQTAPTRNPSSGQPSSRQIFETWMKDRTVAESYRLGLLEDLSSEPDLALRNLAISNPILSDLFNSLIEKQQEYVQGLLMQSLSAGNSISVERLPLDRANWTRPRDYTGNTPYDNQLILLYERIARAFGFSTETAQVHTKGEVLRNGITQGSVIKITNDNFANAFAATGSQTLIVTGYTGQLLGNYSIDQIAAIIAHELGHVRAEHVLLGVLDQVMLSLVYDHFKKISGIQSSMAPDESEYLNFRIQSNMAGHQNVESEKPAPATLHSDEVLDRWADLSRKKLTELSVEDQYELLQSYFNQLETRLELFPKDDPSKELFSKLKYAIDSSIKRIEVQDPQMFIEDLNSLLVKLQRAQSRAAEYTADSLAATIVPNRFLAKAILQLNGRSNDILSDRKTLQYLMDSALADAEANFEFARDVIGLGDRPEQLSGHASHPNSTERIYRAITHSKILSILYANPFIRLIMTERAVSNWPMGAPTPEDPEILGQMRDQIIDLLIGGERGVRPAQNLLQRLGRAVRLLPPKETHNPRFENFVQAITILNDLNRGQFRRHRPDASEETLNRYLERHFPQELVQAAVDAYQIKLRSLVDGSPEALIIKARSEILSSLSASNDYELNQRLRTQVNPQLHPELDKETPGVKRRDWPRLPSQLPKNFCSSLI